MSKVYFCNTVNPSLTKLAIVSGNKLTGIAKIGNKLTCKLNGQRMTCKDARKWLLDNYRFVDANNREVK